ncbi:MAG: hypothetical protein ACOYXN_12055 [Acidobacteriota bacterium]
MFVRLMRPFALCLTLAWAAVPWAHETGNAAAANWQRIFAAAQRRGVAEDQLLPLLKRVDRLTTQGLPTDWFTDQVVEGLAKGVAVPLVLDRAAVLEDRLVTSRAWIEDLKGRGVDGTRAVEGRTAVEDLAESLVTAPLQRSDLDLLQSWMNTRSLSRLLAAADALSHLRQMNVAEGTVERLFRSLPDTLSDAEVRYLNTALSAGRRRGLNDDQVAADLASQVKKGGRPSEFTRGLLSGSSGSSGGAFQGAPAGRPVSGTPGPGGPGGQKGGGRK